MRLQHRALTANGYGEAAVDSLLVQGYPGEDAQTPATSFASSWATSSRIAVAVAALVGRAHAGFYDWFNNDLEPATTMLELPDMYAEGPGMNSRNHHMFASVGAFLYDLVGIKQAPGSTGWQKALISPAVTTHPDVPWASGRLQTFNGLYSVSWQALNGEACLSNIAENTVVQLACPGDNSNVMTNITFAGEWAQQEGACWLLYLSRHRLSCLSSPMLLALALADFGTSTGTCGTFQHDPTCTFANTTALVASMCIGKHNCTINVSDTVFGDPCYGERSGSCTSGDVHAMCADHCNPSLCVMK